MPAALTERTYIVTGASRGFGLAITEALLEAGAKVDMIARNNERFTRDLHMELQAQGIGVSCIRPGGADAVLYCLAAPAGMTVNLLEVGPNTPTEKLKL